MTSLEVLLNTEKCIFFCSPWKFFIPIICTWIRSFTMGYNDRRCVLVFSSHKCYDLCVCVRTGCLNGGGQLKPVADHFNKELLQQVEAAYRAEQPSVPEEDQRVSELYHTWLKSMGEEKARELLHTQYHAVEKSTSGLTIKWWKPGVWVMNDLKNVLCHKVQSVLMCS